MRRSYLKLLLSCSLVGQVFVASVCFAQGAEARLVERGKYLAIAADCNACHRDPVSGNAFAGGYRLKTPLGDIVASNITPSKTSGIGEWSLSRFSDAVRKGRVGLHFLYPAMPYPEYSGISDEDITALYSYFQLGVRPDDHVVPQTHLKFPFNVRWLMAGWNMLFLRGSPPPPGAHTSGVERGKYLANALGHCSSCHTPRNMFMATNRLRYLAGGKVGGWTAPNITPDRQSGIGQWSEQDIVSYLKTGVARGKAIAAGDMAAAVENSFSLMNDEDLRDIARYLKSLPAIHSPNLRFPVDSSPVNVVPAKRGNEPGYLAMINVTEMSGADLYDGACASCHGHDGHGSPGGEIPPLAGVSITGSDDPSDLILTISEGVNRNVAGHHAFMPAFGSNKTSFDPQFTPIIIAKIADYVSSSFGKPSHHVSLNQVEFTLSSEEYNKPSGLIEYLLLIYLFFFFAVSFLVAWFLWKKRLPAK